MVSSIPVDSQKSSDYGINKVLDEYNVNIYGENVYIDLENNIEIKSERVSLSKNRQGLSVSIGDNSVDMRDSLTIDDVYNIPEDYENIYSPNKDLRNDTIVD